MPRLTPLIVLLGSFAGGAPAQDRFMEVALTWEGAGRGYFAESIQMVLDAAKRNGVQTVVFNIEPGQHFPDEAREIARVINAADDLRTIAVCQLAVGAIIWPIMACDEILIVEKGGINATSMAPARGDANDIDGFALQGPLFADELGAYAQKNGRPAPIARAMINREEELWVVTHPDGSMGVANSTPWNESSNIKATRIDGATTVFTLSAHAAERFGMSRTLPQNADLEDFLGMKRHPGASSFANQLLRRHAIKKEKEYQRERKESREERRRILMLERHLASRLELIDASYRTPKRLEPGEFSDYRYDGSGRMQPASKQKWQERTDDAITAWGVVLTDLNILLGLQAEATKRGISSGVTETDIEARMLEVEANIDRLRKERDRGA
jgi:hypothetical protein